MGPNNNTGRDINSTPIYSIVAGEMGFAKVLSCRALEIQLKMIVACLKLHRPGQGHRLWLPMRLLIPAHRSYS